MIHTNRFADINVANRRPPAGESVRCPRDREHSVRMDWETLGGIRTGRMVAWCYDCGCAIPPVGDREPPRNHCSPAKLAALAETRARRKRPHLRARNDEIRAALRGGTRQRVLAERYGLSVQTICNIGRMRTAS
jgi:hypothetical protein